MTNTGLIVVLASKIAFCEDKSVEIIMIRDYSLVYSPRSGQKRVIQPFMLPYRIHD